MPGILYYDQYLDTLRSTNDFISIFPSNQRTYTTQVQGTSSYIVTATWITLIVDPVQWYSNGDPNFYSSQVVGYYTGGSTSQFSTGVISLPQYLYTGPILPTSDRNVPITIVQMMYTVNQQTYHHRFGLIQEWEPGVTILDPIEDPYFIPISEEGLTNVITVNQSLEPYFAIYSTGSATTYSLIVEQNPGFSANPNPISNTVTIKITDQGLPIQIISDQVLTTNNFVNGITSVTFTITDSLIDIALSNPNTEYEVTTATIVGNNYHTVFSITNYHKIRSDWQNDFTNQYKGGYAELNLAVRGQKQQVITGTNMSLTVSTSENPVDIQENFNITLDAGNVSFNNTISLFLSTGSSTSTIGQFIFSNIENVFTTTISIFTAGVYVIYAKYPGDIITNTSTALLPSHSNFYIQSVLEGFTLPTTSSFTSTQVGDQITVFADSTVTTLTNIVSFFEGSTFLGTATFNRQIISINTVTTSTTYPDLGYFPIYNHSFQPQATPYWTSNFNPTTSTYRFIQPVQIPGQVYETRQVYPFNYWPMRKTLVRYKSSNENTATWLLTNTDDIQNTSTFSVKLGTKGYNVIGIVAIYSPFYNPNGAAVGIKWPEFFRNLPRPVLINNDEYTLVEWLGYGEFVVQGGGPYGVPVWVHYYRFTPEIPPSNTVFNLRRDYAKQTDLDTPNINMVSRNPITHYSIGQVTYNPAQIYNAMWFNNYDFQRQPNTSNSFFLLYDGPPPANADGYGYLIDLYGKINFMWYDRLNRNLYRLNHTNYNPPYVPGQLQWNLITTGTNYNPPDQSNYINIYNNFGNQVWISSNLNDPNANEIARRANNWFSAVTANQLPYYSFDGNLRAPAFTVTSTVTNITYGNKFIAQLTLSTGTVTNPSNLTATWPGTLSLNIEYGKYNPFNINITYP